jgi:hypothetical protein
LEFLFLSHDSPTIYNKIRKKSAIPDLGKKLFPAGIAVTTMTPISFDICISDGNSHHHAAAATQTENAWAGLPSAWTRISSPAFNLPFFYPVCAAVFVIVANYKNQDIK